jgi:hypothetical protein
MLPGSSARIAQEVIMPRKQHVVTLTADQRADLRDRLRRGAVPALTQTRARILLHADTSGGGPRLSDVGIAAAVGWASRTVARGRAAWTDRGMACLERRPSATPPVPKLSSADEARLVAVACGPPPPGQARWPWRLLAGRAVELELAEPLSYETVRRTLKTTGSNRG